MKRIDGILLLILILCTLVQAKEERRPIHIQADNAVWDKKKNLTVLRGNVVITYKETKLEASVVKAFGELDNLKRIMGEGKIRIVDSASNTTITGGYVEYDYEREYAFITLNPVLKREGNNLLVTSGRMEHFFKEKRSVATQMVEIHYRDLIAKGKEALFYEDGSLILTGEPQIIQSENRFSGEKITIYTREERLEILGDVRGTILREEEQKN